MKHFSFCILCSADSFPDAMRNVLLFVPLGFVLAHRRYSAAVAVLFGALFSLGIELLQFLIPGRYPTFQDIVTNSLGALIGFKGTAFALRLGLADVVARCQAATEHLKRPHHALGNRLALASTVLAITLLAASSWLLSPAFPVGSYLVGGKELRRSDGPLRLGYNGDRTGYYKGLIDEVRIYNRALTPDEIQRDMETPVGNRSPHNSLGLVAAYSFDEVSQDLVSDRSDHANYGRMLGVSLAPGHFGQALRFDGIQSRFMVNPTHDLDLATSMTLEAWIRPEDSTSSWPTVIQKGDDDYFLYAGADMFLTPNSGGTFGGPNEGVVAPSNVIRDHWVHLASTYDGSSLKIYVDARPVAQLTRWYKGHVHSTLIGSTLVRPGFVNADWVRDAIALRYPIRLWGVVGPLDVSRGPLLDIRNKFPGDRLILLAAQSEDMLLRFYTVGESLGLLSPEIRVPGALRTVAPGTMLDIELSGGTHSRKLTINGTSFDDLGLSLGMGWSIVTESRHTPTWLFEILNLAWLGILAFPAGYWSKSWFAASLSIVSLGGTLLILPTITTLAPTPPSEWIGAAAGFLVGIAGRRMIDGSIGCRSHFLNS